MGVRGVAQLFVFIVTLFTIVAGNRESKNSEERLLANQISSVGINQELVGDAPAHAPAPATSSSETPDSPPPARPPSKPFFPRDYHDSSKSSAPSSTSQNSTSDGQSNKRKSNTKTVLVAVLTTAAVTFIVVALFFICYCKVCGAGYRKGKNDERPLLSLIISDYSVASLHGNAVNHSVSDVSDDKMGKNYYMESNTLNGSKSEIPLGTVTGIAVAAAGNSAQVPPGRMGMHGQPPLKPPPGRVNPFEDPASPAKAANLGPPCGSPCSPAPGLPPGRVNPFEDPASPAKAANFGPPSGGPRPPAPGLPPARVNPFEDPASPAPLHLHLEVLVLLHQGLHRPYQFMQRLVLVRHRLRAPVLLRLVLLLQG